MALYGERVPPADQDPTAEHDAYQLFHERSLAMGWLDERSSGGEADQAVPAPGLWAMNDAGWQHPLAAGTGLISWYQVEASAPAGARPLPVQPVLRCAMDATSRTGEWHLSTVQVLLPVQGLDPTTRPAYAPVPSMLTVDWFAEANPRPRTAVEVNISSGQDPAVHAVAQQLIERLEDLDQDVFRCTGSGASSGVVPEPPFDDGFWNGPPLHGRVLEGTLSEWSLDAIGWLAAVIADLAALLGVRRPLLVTVTRVVPPVG